MNKSQVRFGQRVDYCRNNNLNDISCVASFSIRSREKYANSRGNELIGFSMKIERIRMRGTEISLSNLHMARSCDE